MHTGARDVSIILTQLRLIIQSRIRGISRMDDLIICLMCAQILLLQNALSVIKQSDNELIK